MPGAEEQISTQPPASAEIKLDAVAIELHWSRSTSPLSLTISLSPSFSLSLPFHLSPVFITLSIFLCC